MHCRLKLHVFGSAALILAGCGSSGPERFPLSGNVEFQGAPVAQGSIRFVPEAKDQQPEGAVIRDGRYSAMLTAGKKKVTIEAFRPKKEDPNIPKRPGGVPLGGAIDTEMYIPEEYNSKTTLVVEAGPETDTKDFTLQ